MTSPRVRASCIAGLSILMACGEREPAAGDRSESHSRVILRESDVDFRVEGVHRGGAIPLSPSSFALLDYRGKQVVVLDTTGVVIGRFGRAGGGPGELLFAQRLVRLGDGIAVVDGAKDALVVFGHRGEALGQHAVKDLLGTSAARLTGLAQLPDSAWLFSEQAPIGVARREQLVLRRGSITTIVDSAPATKATHLKFPCGVVVEAAGAPVYTPTLRWTMTAGGDYFSAASDLYHIRRRSGAPITMPIAPRRATRSEALKSPLSASVRTPSASCVLSSAAALEQRGMASTIPAIARLVASPEGTLWVLRESPPGQHGVIDRFDGAGNHTVLAGRAPFPAFFLTESTYVSADSSEEGTLLVLTHLKK